MSQAKSCRGTFILVNKYVSTLLNLKVDFIFIRFLYVYLGNILEIEVLFGYHSTKVIGPQSVEDEFVLFFKTKEVLRVGFESQRRIRYIFPILILAVKIIIIRVGKNIINFNLKDIRQQEFRLLVPTIMKT